MTKKILITGSAGFIGSALTLNLLKKGYVVIGIDNHNNYYDQNLKEDRIKRKINYSNYVHNRVDICEEKAINKIFEEYEPNFVVNLAAQAGVRYSILNPKSYIQSNIIGFFNILECCRHHKIKHLIYASTSSIYGARTDVPFSENISADHPLSFYAATKKSNELMAHSYSHLYNLPTSGLRFFTVYGPWGRPDMALFKFTKAIIKGEPIELYNYGNHIRDFTYIDNIVNGITSILENNQAPNLDFNSDKPDPASSKAPWRVYNIGNNNPVKLRDYVNAIEKSLNKKAIIKEVSLQPGDMECSYANIDKISKDFGYKTNITVQEGIDNFVSWYRDYFKI